MSDGLDWFLENTNFVNEEYAPKEHFLPGTDTLPDGLHDLQVTSVEVGGIQGKPIVRMKLKPASGAGFPVEHIYWLDKQSKVDWLGADLIALGLPAYEWTAARGKAFNVELVQNLPKLVGRKFRVHKFVEDDFVRFRILGLLTPNTPPVSPAPPPRTQAPTRPAQQAPAASPPPPPPLNQDHDMIPF